MVVRTCRIVRNVRVVRIVRVVLVLSFAPQVAAANPESARLRARAYEYALNLDASRKDAGLVVGMYRYVVSQMSLPLRMMAYVAGFGGGKERGLLMIEESAASLWYQKRGAARVALRRLDEAGMDLRRSVSAVQARTWVKGRAYAELGKIADLRRDRAMARANFQKR